MRRRIAVIQGHPDRGGPRFCHALADAYAAGAGEAGHPLRRVEAAALDFPLLASRDEWEQGELPPSLVEAQASIEWAEHLVLVFPLWQGTTPALLKGFLEQVLRPGFVLGDEAHAGKRRLRGRSARIVVTMGMPALVYRWWFGAHGVRGLRRSVLGFVGISPVRTTLIGGVEGGAGRRRRWLERMQVLGRAAR